MLVNLLNVSGYWMSVPQLQELDTGLAEKMLSEQHSALFVVGRFEGTILIF